MILPSSSSRAGLTLIEVVVALALLTLVAVTCLPLLRQATHFPLPVDRSLRVHAVRGLADHFLEAPEHFGYDELSYAGYLSGPDDIDEDPLAFRRLEPRESEIDHHWMAFTRDGVRVFRWVPAPPEPEQAR